MREIFKPSEKIVFLVAMASLLLACNAERSRPDILLISFDTLRADRLSCYGYGRATSPTLDALARSGVRFGEAHAPASNTAPSHMSLLTGLDPLAHGVKAVGPQDPVPRLSTRVPTLAELLLDAGYATIGLADDGWLHAAMGFERGFEVFDSRRESLPAKIERARRLVAEAPADRPLFLFFHTYETHAPYLPPRPFFGRFHDRAYRGEVLSRYLSYSRVPPKVAFRELPNFLATFSSLGDDDLAYLSDLYDEGIAYADSQLAVLLEVWASLRGSDDTLFVVVSDHGEGFLEHGELDHRYDLFRELMLVPFVMAGPGLEPRVVEEPASLTDLLPTVLDYLGLPPANVQGRSLLAAIRGERDRPTGPVFSQLVTPRGLRDAVKLGKLRVMRETRGSDAHVRVFDWSQDPLEQNDLAGGSAPAIEALLSQLDARRSDALAHQRQNPSGAVNALSEQMQAELRAIGYLRPTHDGDR